MLDRIGLVFQHLKEFNLKIKPKKSFFFQTNVLFLGHILSKEGISPNPEKISKVRDWPIPKMAKELHSFSGLASYYWRFIPQFTKWANPLDNLIHPVTTKKKHVGQKLPLLPQNLPPFIGDSNHQESLDKLKKALISSPVLAYPDYNKPFVLETDASLKGLSTVLSQEDDEGNYWVISFPSHAFKSFEWSMQNYSSAKLELLALKWAVCDKLRDYLIGSKFTVLTDNNPPTHVHTSHLGATQICWLSDLMLFDFDLKYRAGKSNQMADALSQWPINPESSSKSLDNEEEWKTITYEMICQILDYHLDSNKLPCHLKHEVQTNITDVERANQSLGFKSINVVDVQLRQVNIFNSFMPTEMAEFQKKDNQLSIVYEHVTSNSKPKLSEIHHIRSKPVCRFLLQFDCLSLIWGDLYHWTLRMTMKSNC